MMSKRRPKKSSAKNLHLRDLKSVLFNESNLTSEFQLFVDKEIWPQLKSLHKKYFLEENKKLTAQIVHNLIETGLTNKTVADSRNKNNKQVRKRVPIWDALAKKKLCKSCKGSEISGLVTRYYATNPLLGLREKWELKLLEDLDLKKNTEEAIPTSHALVVLYRGKVDWLTGQSLPNEQQKRPQSILKRIEATCQRNRKDIRKPDPQAIQNGLDYFREIENNINTINEENLSHSWLAYASNPDTGNKIAFQPNVCLRQIHSGKLFRGTRLYSWGTLSGQGISKEQRQTIQIDGESAAEIDSHCHAIRLAYHLSGIDKRGDVYWPEKIFRKYYTFKNVSSKKLRIVRDFVKTSTNIVLNTSNSNSARNAIATLLKDSNNREFLTGLIFKTEATNLKGILERIIKAHPKKVADKFFADYGLDLMCTDGSIMLHVLNEFVVNRQKPALAIHDSLVIKASDVIEAEKVFTKTYHKFTGFKPVLQRKF
ncbi:MAG: hypothetical protein MUO22_08640 [Sedimentisphaerales bacterium]|nr:hypothetical protein [Sedimentisphaerales bacterium]